MSTRSVIAAKFRDGTYRSVYCHFDGYIMGGVGEKLYTSYNTQEQVEELILHGDISSLEDDLSTSEFFHRDRGEAIRIRNGKNVREAIGRQCGQEYNYYWNGEKWLVSGAIRYFSLDAFIPLDEAIKKDASQ
jgi:hypothetical protein